MAQEVLDGLGNPIPERWLKLNHEEQMWWAQDLVNDFVKEMQLGQVFVVDIKNNHRLVLSEQEPINPETGKQLLRLEKTLRFILGFGAEVQMEGLEDRNKRHKRQIPSSVKVVD